MEGKEEGKKAILPFLPSFPFFRYNAAFFFRNGYIKKVDSEEILNEKVEPEVDWWEERQMWIRKLRK